MHFMNKTFIVVIVIFLSVGISLSCSKGGSGDPGTGTGTGGTGGTTLDCSVVANKAFTADINPIIQSTCNVAGCHNAGSFNGVGPLTNYTEIFNARASIRSAIATGLMPQGSTLPAAQRNSILCWIDSGAPNN
jgi:hypothetical protein